MSDEKYTRCPACATVFRVTAEQLTMREGQVRCGQCKAVFDGIAQQVSLAAATKPDMPSSVDAVAAGAPTLTEGDALEMDAANAFGATDAVTGTEARSTRAAPGS